MKNVTNKTLRFHNLIKKRKFQIIWLEVWGRAVHGLDQMEFDLEKQWTKYKERGEQDWRRLEKMMSWKNTEN